MCQKAEGIKYIFLLIYATYEMNHLSYGMIKVVLNIHLKGGI